MTPATHYMSESQGPTEISKMGYRHAKAALTKLQELNDPKRQDEVIGLADRVAFLADTSDAHDPLPADHQIGANKPPVLPPVPETFEALKVHIEGLYEEAGHWLDGKGIENQAQADAVARLRAMLDQAHKAADQARKDENTPFDEGKAAVQAKYAPLIADTKAVTGLTIKAMAVCKVVLKPWLQKLDEERRAEAERLRGAAMQKQMDAQAASMGAASLETRDAAEAMFTDAQAMERQARATEASRARVGAGEGFRGAILRDNWIARLTDGQEALRHYWLTNRPALERFALELAQADVRAGKRAIPGFEVVNDQRVG